ncbi:MAG: phosphatase PAP2 family protein [Patescibacteria group bacterium]
MNETFFYLFNNLALKSEVFDTFAIFCADWLVWWMIVFFIFIFFYKKIALNKFFVSSFSVLTVWGIAKIVKEFYFSPRPFVILEKVNLLFSHGLNDSMPSGHTVLVFALAVAVFKYNKIISAPFFLGAVLIALSRVVVGVHWPLDILAGAVLGIVGVLVVEKILIWFYKKYLQI